MYIVLALVSWVCFSAVCYVVVCSKSVYTARYLYMDRWSMYR